MIGRFAMLRSRLQRTVSGLLFGTALLVSGKLHSQTQNYGAPFLLLPLGAHAVGLSDAVVADTTLGTEAIWWNPAGLARLKKRELALHHSQTFSSTTDMLSFVYPSRIFGTFALGGNLVNFGDIPATDKGGNDVGILTNRNYLLVASYATPIGKRLSVGLNAKVVLLRTICSGCEALYPNIEGSTNALDAGLQYVLPTSLPITIGASLRNIGQPLQVKDAEQADPLARVIQVGARVRLPIAALDSNDTSIDISSDVFSSPAYTGPSFRLGASLTYSLDYVLRVGYKTPAGASDNQGGFSIGFGLARAGFGLDFARRFDSTSDFGKAPTYVSLRLLF